MERIKVDTTVLREKSKIFETSASVYAKGGSELLSLVAGLPSYDGQLSGPARASALEVNRQCQELHDCLLSDAQSLTRTAQAFEEVDGQTINIILSAQGDINQTRSLPNIVNIGFIPPDDSNLFGPFHGIWFTYNSDSWNPFRRGVREEEFGGKLTGDATKWIGYEYVLGDPNKVVIWYNPLPPAALPDPPFLPRVYDKNDPNVQLFLLAEENLEKAYQLIEAYTPDILKAFLGVGDIVTFVKGILEGGMDFLQGLGATIKDIADYQSLLQACTQFDQARKDLETYGNQLFNSNTPYGPYKPYGDEILTAPA